MQWAPTKIRVLALHANSPSSLCTACFKVCLKGISALTATSKAEPTLEPDLFTRCTAYARPQRLSSGMGNQENQANEYTCQCLHVDPQFSPPADFPSSVSSQHKHLAPGVTAEPEEQKRDLRKRKPNPKPALHCVGRNQFRNNVGNFWPNQPSATAQPRRAGLSPFSLLQCPTYFTGWKCACVCSSNHSLLLKPPKHSSACSASYTAITRHHNLYKIPQERPAHVSQLPVSSYCLWRSSQISV